MSDVKALVTKFVESVQTTGTFMETLAVIRSKIEIAEKVTKEMSEKFREWGMGQMVDCPHCGSHTLLEFVSCHWCGHQILETVGTTEKKEEVKLETILNEVEKVEEEAPVKEKKPRASKKTKEAPAPKVEVKEDSPRTVKVQMGDEPAATINFGGAPSSLPKDKQEKAGKSEPTTEDKIATLKEVAETAADKETDVASLREILAAANLPVNVGDYKKVSHFRQAIVDALHAQVAKLEEQLKADAKKTKVKEAPVKEEKKDKKARGTKKKEEPKETEPDEDFPEEMEEVPSQYSKPAKKGPKVLEITDEDLDDVFVADEEEEDDENEITIDDEGIEGIDLESIDVDDLSDEDFDLEDE